MNTIIINDCRDANAAGRQTARTASLLGGNVSFVGVRSDLEAAGNLVDTMDALQEQPGVILVNVAPRNGNAKKWANGTPFGYFRYKNILVLASVDGVTLSLVKKLGLASSITVLDIPETLDELIAKKLLSPELKDHITNTQFRSYDFLPRAAAFLAQGNELPGARMDISEVPDAPPAIWWIDNFGNCKTTLTHDELSRTSLVPKFADVRQYEKLKDVPDNTPAFISGSSGASKKRFLEIVVQGGSAEAILGLSSGEVIA